ncbi:hypothetical protein K502DRAFT_325547 [Neoconidiobolus thromboides FSU 785]|nr:hypothetical protein K502DRAFT_325547 [Neoconidiobolus thromboides FSU 785]
MKTITYNPMETKSLTRRQYLMNLISQFPIYKLIQYLIYYILGGGVAWKLLSYILPFIAQKLLNQSILKIDSIFINECQADSMMMYTNLSLEKVGPVPVTIKFDEEVKFGFMKDGEVKIFGCVDMPILEVQPNIRNMKSIGLKLKIKEVELMSEFCKYILNGSLDCELYLIGKCNIYLFGLIPIKNLNLNKIISITGMNSLKELTINKIRVLNGDLNNIYLNVVCNLFNPSLFEIEFGQVNFNLYYKNCNIGHITMEKMNLNCDSNTLDSMTYFHPLEKDTLIAGELLSQFCSGKESDIVIKGNHPNSHPIQYWKEALEDLLIPCKMMGIKEKLIKCARLQLNPSSLLSGIWNSAAPSKLELYNPFECNIYIKKIESDVFMNNNNNNNNHIKDNNDNNNNLIIQDNIGSLIKDLKSHPLLMNSKTITISSQMDLKLNLDFQKYKLLYNALINNQLLFNVEAKIEANLGNYPCEINYVQQNVPIDFGL